MKSLFALLGKLFLSHSLAPAPYNDNKIKSINVGMRRAALLGVTGSYIAHPLCTKQSFGGS